MARKSRPNVFVDASMDRRNSTPPTTTKKIFIFKMGKNGKVEREKERNERLRLVIQRAVKFKFRTGIACEKDGNGPKKKTC